MGAESLPWRNRRVLSILRCHPLTIRKEMKLWRIAFVKKSIGLIVLFLIPRFAIGQNSVDSIVAKQDSSMAIRTDSLCCSRSVCNCDTVQQDSCLQQHRLSFINKGQKMTRDINPNALKMRKFDPYKKKFNDMRIIETIGSHISR